MVLGIQLAGLFFGVFMMYVTFIKYKRKELTTREYGFWMTGWVLFMTVALFPNWLDPIVKTLHFARTFDLLVVGGFLFLIGISFYTYTIVRKNQKQIEEVVRKTALKKK